MPPEYGRQTRNICRVYDQALSGQLCEGFLHVDGVPMYDGIESEAKSAELFFLPLAQGVAHLAPVSMVDFSSEFVSELLTIELNENTPPECGVVDVVQDMQGFYESPQMHEGPRECRGSFLNLQNTHDACGLQMPKLERSGETDQVFLVFGAMVDFG